MLPGCITGCRVRGRASWNSGDYLIWCKPGVVVLFLGYEPIPNVFCYAVQMTRSAKDVPPAVDDAPDLDNPFPDPVVLPVEDILDLHPFAPNEIRGVVEDYLTECCEAGF